MRSQNDVANKNIGLQCLLFEIDYKTAFFPPQPLAP